MPCLCRRCHRPVEDCGELYCQSCLIDIALESNREIKLKDGTSKVALYDEEGNPIWVNVKKDDATKV